MFYLFSALKTKRQKNPKQTPKNPSKKKTQRRNKTKKIQATQKFHNVQLYWVLGTFIRCYPTYKLLSLVHWDTSQHFKLMCIKPITCNLLVWGILGFLNTSTCRRVNINKKVIHVVYSTAKQSEWRFLFTATPIQSPNHPLSQIRF